MSTRWIALLTACLLLAGAMTAQSRVERGSNVIGKQCPEMFLEEWMVQGPEIKQKDFQGKVVFFLFYMRDCEGCELHAMPRLQKIFERYERSKCIKVLAINTAFDKEFKPYTAEVEETRAHLRLKRWTMPVARDRDERSYALFEIDEQSGTPQAVVLDENGKVLDHDWFSTEKEMDRLERCLDAAADKLNCDCIRKPRKVGQACTRAYDAICNGDYTRAWKEADAVASHRRDGDADKKDAEYLKDYIEGIARVQIQKVRDSFNYNPVQALTEAESVIASFKGVTGVSDFATVTGTWRESDNFKQFELVQAEFDRLDSELSNREGELTPEERANAAKQLNELETRAAGTAVADLAKERASGLSIAAPNEIETGSGSDNGGSAMPPKSEPKKDEPRKSSKTPGISRDGRTVKQRSSR
jgi:thiol-disulfide isomerase/thioredoxin